jgi:hypothetical protein
MLGPRGICVKPHNIGVKGRNTPTSGLVIVVLVIIFGCKMSSRNQVAGLKIVGAGVDAHYVGLPKEQSQRDRVLRIGTNSLVGKDVLLTKRFR